MKLKWVTPAVLAATGSSAYAQSSVTLYGAVDGGLLYQSTSVASFSPTAKNLGSVYRYRDGGIYMGLRHKF
jgi:predicted porin